MRKEITLAFLASIFAYPVFGQAPINDQEEQVVVTATRNPLPGRELGASVIVIQRDAMETSGATTVSDVLRGLPGISLRRSGGAGSNTEIIIRGDKGGHTMVMVDGVELADVSTIEKNFDIGDMPLYDVERIEIVKGPHSVAYGASGLSGVIHIITRRPQKGINANVGIEAGSYQTYSANARIAGQEGAFGYAASVYGTQTDGYSHTGSRDHGEADGFERQDASLRLQYGSGEPYSADLLIKGTQSVSDIDGGANVDDPNYQVHREDLSAQLTQKLRVSPMFESRLAAVLVQSDRHFDNEFDTLTPGNEAIWDHSRFQGERRSIDFSQLVQFAPDQAIVLSAQWLRDTAEIHAAGGSSYGDYSDILPEKHIDETSYALQYQWGLWDRVYGQWGVRTLDNSEFGNKTVGQLAFNFVVIPEYTHFRLNVGRGFKTPSLYQLYAPIYGYADLQPETVMTIEGGIEQNFSHGLNASITSFQNQTENLIEFDSASSHYFNINSASIKGLESTLSWDANDFVRTEAQYTHLETLDKETNRPLASRPEAMYSGLLILKYEAFTWKTAIRGQNRSRASYVEGTEGFSVIDTTFSQRLAQRNLSLKIANLTNEEYQEVAGYNTPARSFLINADFSF